MVDPSGPPVTTGPPNARNQTPAFAGQTRAPEVRSNFSLNTQVVTNSLSNPWGIAVMPDGRLLITERLGSMVIVTPDGAVSEDISGVPTVFTGGQGGLLDVTLAPDFATSRMGYISYSEPRGNNQNATAVARANLSANERSLENLQVIFRQQPAWNSNLHFGSRFVWDNNGLLYVSSGYVMDPRKPIWAIRPGASGDITLNGSRVLQN